MRNTRKAAGVEQLAVGATVPPGGSDAAKPCVGQASCLPIRGLQAGRLHDQDLVSAHLQTARAHKRWEGFLKIHGPGYFCAAADSVLTFLVEGTSLARFHSLMHGRAKKKGGKA